jgi:hypothetical protein
MLTEEEKMKEKEEVVKWLAPILILLIGCGLSLLWTILTTPKQEQPLQEIHTLIAESSQDVREHNIRTGTEVKVIRETVKESVEVLDSDELIVSIDEFLQRFRSRGGNEVPPGNPPVPHR